MARNDLPDRVIDHWKKTREILPEVYNLPSDHILELIDGIGIQFPDLTTALSYLAD